MLAIVKGKYTQRLAEARALSQEHKQYGKRTPVKPTVTILTRRNGEIIKRQEYKGA